MFGPLSSDHLDLTRYCIIPTYEYAYATVAGTEASTDRLNELSVITHDSEKHHTKNLDSNTNKIKESNLIYDNDTISSSKNLTTVDIDNSIIKLTNQMKENFVTAKADFDKYVKQNLINPKKNMEKDSITAKESQIRDLLLDSQEKSTQEQETTFPEENIHYTSVKETPGVKTPEHTLTDGSMSQMNNKKDSFDDDSLSNILSVNSLPDNIKNDIEKYSSSSHYSSSSSSSIQSSSSEGRSFNSEETNDTSSSVDSLNSSYLNITHKKKRSRKKNSNRKKKKNKYLNSDKGCYHAY